tara:strand:- start:615 stop:1040 length:426 start_codon:yes stop_codon:yes gene_type:complete
MAQETIKITQTKGEFLELLKGLWSASHLKGKELSVLINDNATLIRNLLDTLLWVNPSDEFAAVARQISRLQKTKEDGWEAKVIELEDANKDIIDARNEQIANMKTALEEEATLELKLIPDELFTDEVTANILFSLDSIVKK